MAINPRIPKGARKRIRASHHAQTGKYARQRLRTERNRLRKRQQRVSLHPDDLQALAALKKLL